MQSISLILSDARNPSGSSLQASSPDVSNTRRGMQVQHLSGHDLCDASGQLTQAPSVSWCQCPAQPRRAVEHRVLIAGAVTLPQAPAALCSHGPRPHAGGWHHTDSSLVPQHCSRAGLLPTRRELLKRRVGGVPLQLLHLRRRSQPRQRLEPDRRARSSGRGPALGRAQHPCHNAGFAARKQGAPFMRNACWNGFNLEICPPLNTRTGNSAPACPGRQLPLCCCLRRTAVGAHEWVRRGRLVRDACAARHSSDMLLIEQRRMKWLPKAHICDLRPQIKWSQNGS